MAVWTGNGKVLIAWDMGCGPTWAYDPEGKPIKEKYLGSCEVWRSADGGVAVNIGETWAEAFLDDQIDNLSCVTYWIMEKMKDGGLRQVGPSIDVTLPPASRYEDQTPPSPPNELKAKRKAGGNELSWLASCDDESGVLAYFVYSANEHQPDSIIWTEDPLGRPPYGDAGLEPEDDYAPLGEVPPVWQLDENGGVIIDEYGNRKTKTAAHYKWLDRTTDGKKPYTLAAIDGELNLSDQTGRVDPWTGEPPPSVWPAGTQPSSYVGSVKERAPVEPVVPEGGAVSTSVYVYLDSGNPAINQNNYENAVWSWSDAGEEEAEFECFMAIPGDPNVPVEWTGNYYAALGAHWGYPNVWTRNAYWRSLGVKTARPPTSVDDFESNAEWDIPDDAEAINLIWSGREDYFFCFRALSRIDEPGDPPDEDTYPEWDPGTHYSTPGWSPPNYCRHEGHYYICRTPSTNIEPPQSDYWTPVIVGGLQRAFGLSAYWPLEVTPGMSGYVSCFVTRNYVNSPALYSVAVLETPSNYPLWPPEP